MVKLRITLPDGLAPLKFPKSLDLRLQSLLDKQDSGEPLTAAEGAEAEGLVEIAEFLTVLRLQAEQKAS